jgi:hypothetical protein
MTHLENAFATGCDSSKKIQDPRGEIRQTAVSAFRPSYHLAQPAVALAPERRQSWCNGIP